MKKLILVLVIIIPSILFSQHKQILIKTGKLFNSELGVFETGMDIIINGDRIEDVKQDKTVQDAERNADSVIDLTAYAILPGLIDAHTHLLFKEELHPGMDFSALSMEKTLTMQGDAYRAIYGSVKAKGYLLAGITSVQDLGNSGKFADIALKKAIEDGLVAGPRMRCAGQGLSSEGGQLPGLIYTHRDIVNDEYRIVKNIDDGVQAVRENITQGADVIKIYSNNTPNKTALSIEEIKAIVKEAHRYHVRVTAHATDNDAVYNAVVGGVDGIEHGYQVDDTTLALMAAKKVILVPTDGDSDYFKAYAHVAFPNDTTVKEHIAQMRSYAADRLNRAIKNKVTIAAGSDDYVDVGLPFGEPSKRTIIGYVEDGVSINNALQFSTINASKQLNWSNEIGIIKKGYYADIIAVDLNADKNIHAILNVHFVMKGGVTYVNR